MLWLKILVPVLIVAAIAVIFIVKNASEEDAPDLPDELFGLNATTEIDFASLAEYGLPVIVDYGADSCIPCKQMAPVLKTMNAEMKDKAFIKFVDVWKYGSAANNVPIQIIPSQVFFNADGTPYVPSDSLKKQIGGFKLYNGFTVHEGGLTEDEMRAILAEMGVK
ncbi:MAG: thioredoxin family protein [Ruminococcaceae bacterium]|nr:thioredoxin family protein [Oscillospiraceae bacterium]